MREDPIISGGWIKAALVILVGGALGVGAYLLASDADINLPDIPGIEGIGSGGATNLADTTLNEMTIGQAQPESPALDAFTTAGSPRPSRRCGTRSGRAGRSPG